MQKLGGPSPSTAISFFSKKKRLQLQKFNFGRMAQTREAVKYEKKQLQSILQKGRKENHVTFTYKKEERHDLASI